jgi:hypothetical protein
MKIANPIYDIVFKYLMEDNDIAKGLLSAILNVQILSLEMKPQELSTHILNGIRLFRIDFKAIIRTNEGHIKTVTIELQKDQKGYEIERFRRYMGINYQIQEEIINDNGEPEKVTLPIIAIYFLGYKLKKVKTPILKVVRTYENVISNRKLKVREEFVENLSHDLYVIQIKRLNMVAQTPLEKQLDVFNQKKYITDDKRILDFTGDTSDPLVALIIKRLEQALLDEEMLRVMRAEEEVENAFYKKVMEIQKLQEKFEEERQAKEEERQAKERFALENDTLKQQLEALKKQLEQKK